LAVKAGYHLACLAHFQLAKALGARVIATAGSDDKLAYLLPIRLGAMCTNCHGPSARLADGVAERLEEMYPNDQATGFKPGELRGWFWVEVPES
jgi:NADPH:quinone reductase-like Zn-dependent oxidoreductase